MSNIIILAINSSTGKTYTLYWKVMMYDIISHRLHNSKSQIMVILKPFLDFYRIVNRKVFPIYVIYMLNTLV